MTSSSTFKQTNKKKLIENQLRNDKKAPRGRSCLKQEHYNIITVNDVTGKYFQFHAVCVGVRKRQKY